MIAEYLKHSASLHPEKIAYSDEKRSITYEELKNEAYHVASVLISKGLQKTPIAVFMDKSVECIVAFIGVACSGNFYSPIDTKMPEPRIRKILQTLDPVMVITSHNNYDEVGRLIDFEKIVIYEDVVDENVDYASVENAISRIVDTDILYILFTSGSTGNPKGVIISHRALIDFVEWATKYLSMDDSYVLGNQTPFYFSMSVFDIYTTLKNAATLYIIPHGYFTLPSKLMEYMYEKKINTLFWVPSAMMMVSALNVLDAPHLPELRNVFFGGEVMPMKQLNKWRKSYPNVRYINFYGPTEVTDTCTVYEVNREFSNTESLPMGTACENMDVFLLDEDDKLIEDDKIGEVCVRGTGLAYGYYNDPEKTAAVFVQNPLNSMYPETIYRTGDLAKRNQFGEFVYMGRKDYQIKHMGHRIELGEIETAVLAVDGVEEACCIYNREKSRIILFYTGAIEDTQLIEIINKTLPIYMIPNQCVRLDVMPKNLNGKIDRQKLKAMR